MLIVLLGLYCYILNCETLKGIKLRLAKAKPILTTFISMLIYRC